MRRVAFFAMAVIAACVGAAPRVAYAPPTADTDVALSDGRTLHVRELPLGRVDGTIVDGAQFDATSARLAFLARFPNAAVDGDWRHAAPTQAYVADLRDRTLTALTGDGLASAIRWVGGSRVAVTDAGVMRDISVASGARVPTLSSSRLRIESFGPSIGGALVTPSDEFRLQVYREDSGAYAIGQVGAVRLRVLAVAPDHTIALVGSLVVWIDAMRSGGRSFSRDGPDTVLPASFAGTPYGDELTPVLPLGHVVYQGAYRDGVAYVAFTIGLKRIVATTRDFVDYAFPALPPSPDFSVGDGMGAGADDVLYFADPMNRVVQLWNGARYVEHAMTFPDNVSSSQRLNAAIAAISGGSALWPVMRPDADALDAALLEWRIYPIGDVTGQHWVASYLGRSYVGASDLQFHAVDGPGFPFAVIGRTDDGRLWGATPVSRQMRGGAIVEAYSRVWSSRDGVHWGFAATLPGDVGAVGLRHGAPWVALSAFEGDASGVEVARLDDHPIVPASTGAIYAGEDMYFADTSTGFFLVCGGVPGTRTDDGSGPLEALALDADQLFTFDGHNRNAYLEARLNPFIAPVGGQAQLGLSSPSTEAAFLQPSVAALMALHSPYRATVVSDGFVSDAAAPANGSCCRYLSTDAERRFEIEYAWHPYPLARVVTTQMGDTAVVHRTLERGPLAISGQDERWSRNTDGVWHLLSIFRHWSI